MKCWASLALLLFYAFASADRLISTPTGKKIAMGDLRVSYQYGPRQEDTYQGYFATGLTRTIDAGIYISRPRFGVESIGFDVSYNIIPPFQALTPGLSIGFLDAFDQTEDGRRPFLALTFVEDYYSINSTLPGEVTLGFIGGKKQSPFFGLIIPFSPQFKILAEHDGLKPSLGFDIYPFKRGSVRVGWRGSDFLVGFNLVQRFRARQ